MAACKHPADIFRKKKCGLKLSQDANIIKKELSACILDASERARLRPRLAWWTANDSIYAAMYERHDIRFADILNIARDQMRARVIAPISLKDRFVKFICDRNFKTSLFKAQIQSPTAAEQRKDFISYTRTPPI